MDLEKLEQAVKMILEAIGEDPSRPGLKDTPKRVARMYAELFKGLQEEPEQYLQVAFSDQHEEMVLLKNIALYSICEHHLLPFLGKAHVGYIPQNGRLVGISKLARVVETLSRRPQVQERLTTQIADVIEKVLQPRGVVVVLEAEHMCMSLRGVQKPGVLTVTSAVRGIFRQKEATRAEAFSLITGK
jgi:GTP cyclohydrolase I